MTKQKSAKAIAIEVPASDQEGKVPTPQREKGSLPALKRALVETLDRYHEAWTKLQKGKALRLERDGKPVAVVMAYDDFEELLERLEDLEDAQAARDALKALQSGEETTVPWEKVKADLVSEGLLDE